MGCMGGQDQFLQKRKRALFVEQSLHAQKRLSGAFYRDERVLIFYSVQMFQGVVMVGKKNHLSNIH